MSKIKIAQSAFIISFGTVLSRIFGYVRDLVIAFFFGTGTGAQAFVVAFRIPNLLRQLVGEGAASAALVPVFSEYLSVHSEKDFKNLAAALFSIFSAFLIAVTALGILFAPLIVKIMAPGFLQESDLYKFTLTVRMTQVMFPYILLIGLGAWCMGILHSLKIFAPSSFGPVFLNLSIIASIFFFRNRFAEPSMSLAWGVLIGGIFQLAAQLPPILKQGISFKFIFDTTQKGVKKVLRLLLPRALGSAVYQINVLVDNILGSFSSIVGDGAVAALYFSNRIIQFPLGIFVISLASAALPTMSAHAAQNDDKKFKDTLSFSLRGVFLIMFPAMAGLLVMSGPVIKILFERGLFSSYSTNITAAALFFYSFGLFAYAGTKILTNGFYALQDTKTPVKTALAALLINIFFNLILMWKLKVGGLALATSISGIFNFAALFYLLDKKIGYLDRKRITTACLKIFVSSVIMGIVCYLVFQNIKFSFIEHSFIREAARMALTIISSIAVYGGCVYILGVEQVRTIAKWILKRK